MNNNMIFFCNTCGDMKIITYKYMGNNLHINCECIKEAKKRCYPIEFFLNNNNYQSIAKLICQFHNSSFTYWCNTCKSNICDKCLSMHNNHNLIKLSTILIDNNKIDILEIKVTNFQARLNDKKQKINDYNIFNQKEENEFMNNFQKYFQLNICEIAFVQKMKEIYLNLIKNNMICYQIILNLNYLIDKLNSPSFFDTIKYINNNQSNDKEMDDMIEIYYMIFNSQQYCLLPDNGKEEQEKEVEEKQKTFILERSQAISSYFLDESSTICLDNIPLTETIKISDDIVRAKSINAEKHFFYNNNNINNNNNNNPFINYNNVYQNNNPNILNKSQTIPQKKDQQLQKKNRDIYLGGYKNGKYHGDKSRLIYENGFIYEGSFREGLRHGTGTLINGNNPSSYNYQGGWAYDKKHGKCVEIINGEIFEGQYNNGVREGKCVILYNNKDKFVGFLVNGKKEGYGEQFYFKTNSTYKGEFKNNLYEGKGEITNNNGYYFKGEFLGGLRHGDKCIETKKGEKKYEGQFRRDKMNGKGVYEWYSGESKGDIYNGEFKDDLFDGFGTYKYNDGSIYIGQYLHGVKHGKGKEIYSDGSFYEGEYNEGKKSGKGVFQDFEGNIYEGNFYNGNKHSKGKITFVDGEILEGLWLNGLKEGNFSFTDSNGYKYLRKYIKDELIEEIKEGFISSFFNSIYGKIASFIK